MTRKLFSIITPTYNCGRKIERTIQSVLAQRADLFEYLILDGSSTDGTLRVIEPYRAALKLVSERDFGVYDAMNKGIEMAGGKYLYFLGAGDCLRENILHEITEMMPDDELTFVYGEAYLMQHHCVTNNHRPAQADIRRRNICHQSIFYEQAIFRALGDFDTKYSLYADWEFNMRCYAEPRIQKLYTNRIIADFEGGGLSEQDDLKFIHDFPRLVWRHFGAKEYLSYKAEVAKCRFRALKSSLAHLTNFGAKPTSI